LGKFLKIRGIIIAAPACLRKIKTLKGIKKTEEKWTQVAQRHYSTTGRRYTAKEHKMRIFGPMLNHKLVAFAILIVI
jgi:cell wall assembly regulator SMI1